MAHMIRKKNRNLVEEMLDEKLILDALRCYHKQHMDSAHFNPNSWYGGILADEFNEIEKRLARLTGTHTAKFVQLNRKIKRITK